MGKVVLMGDVSVLDRYQIRESVLRIPEVGLKIREVQSLIDSWCESPQDLYWLMRLDDVSFSRLGHLRGVLVTAVQAGLYERYVRKFGKPEVIVGTKGSLPLLRVLAGQVMLRDVLEKIFVQSAPMNIATIVQPLFQGEFDAIRIDGSEGALLDLPAKTAEELAQVLAEGYGVSEIINVGPGELINRHSIDPTLERLRISESIEVDPMLGWFWPSTRALAV